MDLRRSGEGDKISGNLTEIRYVIESLGRGANTSGHAN